MSESAEPQSAVVAAPRPAAKTVRRSDLIAYAEALGLENLRNVSDETLVDLVDRRLRLIESMPAELLSEIATWASLAAPAGATKFELARRISRLAHVRFPGLSTAALRVMAQLRGCKIEPDDGRESLERKIRAKEGFWAKLRRKRRAIVGGLLAGIIGDASDHNLPEELRPFSMRERIEQEGVVSGLTQRIRGAADDYVREKLDEIEARIDRKLEEIDRRLADWRDKEIINRLRIIRITLIASILVALLSLGYTLLKAKFPGILP